MRWLAGGFLGGLMLCVQVSQARVFSMGSESFATYLRGQYQLAQQKDEAFLPSAGSGTSFNGTYATNLAYEFGFIYATKWLSWRFGFEVIKPAALKDMSGTNTGGTEWYTLGNDISGYVPKVGLEANVKTWGKSRLFVNADYGMATITVQNSYTMTAAGTAQFPGVVDFREEIKGTASMIEGSLGFETLLSDTTTICIDGGYRVLQVNEFTHNLAVQTFQGAVAKGDVAKNTDGSSRTLNLSGGFASIALRFWVK